MILDLLRSRTAPCIQSCLASARSPSTPTACCWPASYLLGLRLAMRARQDVGPRRQPRARPRHLHHHRGARRREAAAARRRLRSVPPLACRPAVARALGRRVLRRPDPRGRRGVLVHRTGTGCRSGRRATSSRRASRSATSRDGSAASRPAAATAGRRTCRGRSLHEPAGRRERRHAARHPAAPDAALRSGRRAADPRSCCSRPSAGDVRSPGARSGCTCSSTPSRASSSSSIAATRAARCSAFSTSQFISLVLVPLSLVDAGLAVASTTPEHAAGDGAAPDAWRRRRERMGKGRLLTCDCRVTTTLSVPLEFVVPADCDGPAARSVSRLGARADYSRSQIQRLIADGHVTVAHARGARPTSRCTRAIASRSTCRRPTPSTRRAREALPLEILYQDGDVVVVNKPAGMVVHPGAGHASGTLVNALLHHVTDLSGIGGELRPGIVHRLDRGHVGRDGRRQERRGAPGARAAVPRSRGREGVHRARLGRRAGGTPHRCGDRARSRPIARRCRRARQRARHAVTRITRAHHLPRRDAVPGRHSHRPHASDSRAPERDRTSRSSAMRSTAACTAALPGDMRAVQRLERPFLHAARLAFKHPRDGRRMEFTAPLPDDLQHVLDELPGMARPRSRGRVNDGLQPIVLPQPDHAKVFEGRDLHRRRRVDHAAEGREARGRDRPPSRARSC